MCVCVTLIPFNTGGGGGGAQTFMFIGLKSKLDLSFIKKKCWFCDRTSYASYYTASHYTITGRDPV